MAKPPNNEQRLTADRVPAPDAQTRREQESRPRTLKALKEERDVDPDNTWVADPMLKIIGGIEASLKKYPPIKLGTPAP
jgi:hypothetical protein